MFKIGIIVLCLCIPNILCLSEEMQELIDMLHKTCREETQVDEATITDAKKGVFADDQKLKCYMKCLMTEMSTMSDDGILDIEAAIALLPEDVKSVIEPTVRKCGAPVGKDPCDSAFLVFKCHYDTDPANFFLA